MKPEELLLNWHAPSHVVDGGLERLLSRWEVCSARVAAGVESEDDFLNDLDSRRWLARLADSGALGAAQVRLHRADIQFLRGTYAARGCVWGDDVATEEGWNPAQHWWYFRELVSR